MSQQQNQNQHHEENKNPDQNDRDYGSDEQGDSESTSEQEEPKQPAQAQPGGNNAQQQEPAAHQNPEQPQPAGENFAQQQEARNQQQQAPDQPPQGQNANFANLQPNTVVLSLEYYNELKGTCEAQTAKLNVLEPNYALQLDEINKQVSQINYIANRLRVSEHCNDLRRDRVQEVRQQFVDDLDMIDQGQKQIQTKYAVDIDLLYKIAQKRGEEVKLLREKIAKIYWANYPAQLKLLQRQFGDFKAQTAAQLNGYKEFLVTLLKNFQPKIDGLAESIRRTEVTARDLSRRFNAETEKSLQIRLAAESASNCELQRRLEEYHATIQDQLKEIKNMQVSQQAFLVREEAVQLFEIDFAARQQILIMKESELIKKTKEIEDQKKSLNDKDMMLRPKIEKEVKMELSKAEAVKDRQDERKLEIHNEEVALEKKQKECQQQKVDLLREQQKLQAKETNLNESEITLLEKERMLNSRLSRSQQQTPEIQPSPWPISSSQLAVLAWVLLLWAYIVK